MLSKGPLAEMVTSGCVVEFEMFGSRALSSCLLSLQNNGQVSSLQGFPGLNLMDYLKYVGPMFCGLKHFTQPSISMVSG